MSIGSDTIDRLLYEQESSYLDFKRDQYPFVGATDDEKSELLKDILAFSNAWIRTDAFILIGIEEVTGKGAKVFGITDHLEDAALQQFVNSKTQRPLHFSYQALPFEGKQIGVIAIPPQDRPIYLTKDYGKLKKDVVYIRRGSSTAVASPDEIAKMGKVETSVPPSLELQWADTRNRKTLGTVASVSVTHVQLPGNIPDYRQYYQATPRLGVEMPSIGRNENYYRDLAEYIKVIKSVGEIDFSVTNHGDVTANDVRIEIKLEDPKGVLILYSNQQLPSSPEKDLMRNLALSAQFLGSPEDITVQSIKGSWLISASFGKIQPKSTVWSESSLFVGAKEAGHIEFPVLTFADNLPEPCKTMLTIDINTSSETLDLEKLLEL